MKVKHLVSVMTFLAFGMFATAGYAINTVDNVSASPNPAIQGTMVTITVTGAGDSVNSICGSSITFGDGGSDSKSPQALPHVYTHTYNIPTVGVQNITVSATGGICTGTPSTTVTIDNAKITSISGNDTVYRNFTYKFKVNGTGICYRFRLARYGEGSFTGHANYDLDNPPELTAKYTQTGTYTIRAWTLSPPNGPGYCKGSASKTITVIDFPSAGDFPLLKLKYIAFIPYKGGEPKSCPKCPGLLKQIRQHEHNMTRLQRQMRPLIKKQKQGLSRARSTQLKRFYGQFSNNKKARKKLINNYDRIHRLQRGRKSRSLIK